MSLISDMLKNVEKVRAGKREEPGMLPSMLLESPEPRRPAWGAWAGWGVAAVAVLAAGPVIMERWSGSGTAPPVARAVEPGVATDHAVDGALGLIHAVSEPAGAGVLLDGRFVGVTPMRFQWSAGQVTLTLKKNGFQDLVAPVQVMAAKEVDFRVSMLPESVAVNGQEPASVSPDELVALAENHVLDPDPEASVGEPVLDSGGQQEQAAVDKKGVAEPQVETEIKSVEEDRSDKKGASAVEKSAKSTASVRQNVARSQPSKRSFVPDVPLDEQDKGPVDPVLAPLMRSSNEVMSSNLNFAYSIQMGAFLDRDSAIREAALWRKRGYDAYVLELWGVKDPTRLWQSVRVGRFNDLVAARVVVEALKKREHNKGFYVARSDSFTPPEGVPAVHPAKIIPFKGPEMSGSAVAQAASETPKTVDAPAVVNPAPDLLATAAPVPAMTPKSKSDEPPPVVTEAQKPVDWQKSTAETVKAMAKNPVDATPSAPAMLPGSLESEYPGLVASRSEEAKPMVAAEQGLVKDGKTTPARIDVSTPAVLADVKQDKQSVPEQITRPDQEQPVKHEPVSTKVEVATPVVQADVKLDKKVVPEQATRLDREQPGKQVAVASGTGGKPMAEKKPVVVAQAPKESEKKPGSRVQTAVKTATTESAVAPVSTDQANWAEKLYQQAVAKKETGDLPGEEALLQKVIQADPNHMQAARRLARIMVETNRADQSLELLRRVAGGRNDAFLAEEDPNLAAFMAALYQRKEEHWQAIDLYEALLKKYPNKGLWQMGMAISLEKVEENGEALQAYKKALASGELSHKLQNFVRKRIEKL